MDLQFVYPWCDLEEIMGHALLLCPRAMQVWRLAGLSFGEVQSKTPVPTFLGFIH